MMTKEGSTINIVNFMNPEAGIHVQVPNHFFKSHKVKCLIYFKILFSLLQSIGQTTGYANISPSNKKYV